ncbi:hypothetical protein E0W68_12205 [Flavobacterium salilacus subsp. salilacus]|uniref:DUF5362 family protein n=1 Tax=Flavobacterium TaxID=237 RepID=UPI001074B0DD|nr:MULTISPECIES: hypothetical protein [Flavobacterium]KAF2516289.1 hypothetical protein E0W68_12205 [Flavobacterium salilacus subsp. salilacus]MBE1613819.1 hypothetical protein [Flavobacterium sp. SaA2.13]NDI99932.1 hypothetical protein [Flavobacterium salilacus subsp. altitudinum]
MEQNSPFDSFELQLTNEAKGFLKTSAGWALFLAVIGSIVILLSFFGSLAIILAGSAMDSAPGSLGAMGIMSSATLGIISLLFTITMFFPVLYLFKFSSSTRKAINENNIDGMTKAFGDLKGYFLWSGILTIFSIVSYLVIIIIAVSAASRLSGM